MPSFYEFFAGGGMAHAGLGRDWTCLFANDIDEKKAASYAANWGHKHLMVGDVAKITVEDLPPQRADLAWASFPCQDLSLAGAGAGLSGDRSGTFHPFWQLMTELKCNNRAPRLVVLENVVGALTAGSRNEQTRKSDGQDFVELGKALAGAGYRFGAVVVDAVHWVPQSRPRLFIIAVDASIHLPSHLVGEVPSTRWHSTALRAAHRRLQERAESAADQWIWWNLPEPPTERVRYRTLEELIEKTDHPQDVSWHTDKQTAALLALMNDVNRAKVHAAQSLTKAGGRRVGTVYKRMRPEEVLGKHGERVLDKEGKPVRKNRQRAEVRFDEIAGCLRTPTGGSSRQTILIVDRGELRSRLLSPLEVLRLMGLADDYKRKGSYNDVYHLAGDGVAVDVVRFLADSILEPVLETEMLANSVSEVPVKLSA